MWDGIVIVLYCNRGVENCNYFTSNLKHVFILFVLLINLCLLKLPSSVAEICLFVIVYLENAFL